VFTTEERKAIREQLDRLIVSSAFRHGKRCPKLLRYVVDYALAGHTESVKERALGTAVFELEPDYDTALHPVVRMTAADIRKRLKGYYQTPGREHEIRVELPRGAYIPVFTFPEIASEDPAPIIQPSFVGRHWRVAISFALLAALCVSVGWKIFAQTTALASFWEPVLDSKASVLLCIPNPTDLVAVRTALATNPQLLLNPTAFVAAPTRDRTSFSDSVALSSVGRFLGSRGSSFFVRRANEIDMRDLAASPAVLIGAFDNRWTLALSNQMRFSFAFDGNTEYIRDSQNPSFRDWNMVSLTGPSEDYGIISRTFAPTTGNLIVTVAGLGRDGTQAAGECVSNANCMEQARKYISGDWKHKNLEMVIATAVTANTPENASVVQAYSW
jgi:hypothetical protein